MHVCAGCASGEGRGLARRGYGRRDDIRAVNQVSGVRAEDSHLLEGSLETRSHEFLLVDEALPEARRALVAGESEVGLEAELTREGREHLAVVGARAGERNALEEGLNRTSVNASSKNQHRRSRSPRRRTGHRNR